MSCKDSNIGQSYSIKFINNSSGNNTFVCYQKQSKGMPPEAQSLAWFVRTAAPDTHIKFTWTVDYSFIWTETEVLRDDYYYEAGGMKKADLDENDQTGFTYANEEFHFTDTSFGGTEGALTIKMDDAIPPNKAHAGIAMSGAGVYLASARKNWEA